MQVRKYQASDLDALFAYWQRLGAKIPYFFPVTRVQWQACLFADQLDNEPKFLLQETLVAEENAQIIGFIQGVQPAFAWNAQGEKYQKPPMGILRHFYFDAGRPEVARQLFASMEPFITQFQHQFAFYHILGMSCNAHHGKLHESCGHVEAYLLGKGFAIEHENVYYGLAFKPRPTEKPRGLLLKLANRQTNVHQYELMVGEVCIGGLHVS